MYKIIHEKNTFIELYPESYSEKFLEENIRLAIEQNFVDYHLVNYDKQIISFIYSNKIPDFILINKFFTEWFIVEVEKSSHSFKNHIFPQVSVFEKAIFTKTDIDYLINKNKRLEQFRKDIESLLLNIPPKVLVIADRSPEEWRQEFNGKTVFSGSFQILTRPNSGTNVYILSDVIPPIIIGTAARIIYQTYLGGWMKLEILDNSILDKYGWRDYDSIKFLKYDHYLTMWRLQKDSNDHFLCTEGHNPLTERYNYLIKESSDGYLHIEREV